MKVKTIIFGGKQLQIGTYKPPIMITDYVYTHQEYTKVAKLVKNRHNVEISKIAVNQAKFIFYRKSRFFQN